MVNKQFYQLDDKQWLFEQLCEKTMTELALELGASRGSVAWACRTFTSEELKQIKFARKGKKIRKVLEDTP